MSRADSMRRIQMALACVSGVLFGLQFRASLAHAEESLDLCPGRKVSILVAKACNQVDTGRGNGSKDEADGAEYAGGKVAGEPVPPF